MGRQAILTEDQKRFIYAIKSEAKKRGTFLTAKEVINQVTDHLVENAIKNKRGSGQLATPEDVKNIRKLVQDEEVAPAAIIDYVTEVNKKLSHVELIDKPWHLGLLRENECHIPAEAIPFIARVCEWAIKAQEARRSGKDLSIFDDITDYVPITVRQAQWIGRLYGFVNDTYHIESQMEWLWTWSRIYALDEIVSQLGNSEGLHDTLELDYSLFKGAWAKVIGDMYIVGDEKKKIIRENGHVFFFQFEEREKNEQAKAGEANGKG